MENPTSHKMPYICVGLEDREVVDGDVVLLSVELLPSDEPVIVQWLHDNCEIQDSSSFR